MKLVTQSFSPHMQAVTALSVLTVACLASGLGCHRARSPGGDSPVTTQRLSGSRLVEIREDLSWTFTDGLVTIENNNQPIPPDLVRELLGNESKPNRIEAEWRFDEQANVLILSKATADGVDVAAEVSISIRPAGHIRVNIGSRQYNLFRNTTKVP